MAWKAKWHNINFKSYDCKFTQFTIVNYCFGKTGFRFVLKLLVTGKKIETVSKTTQHTLYTLMCRCPFNGSHNKLKKWEWILNYIHLHSLLCTVLRTVSQALHGCMFYGSPKMPSVWISTPVSARFQKKNTTTENTAFAFVHYINRPYRNGLQDHLCTNRADAFIVILASKSHILAPTSFGHEV